MKIKLVCVLVPLLARATLNCEYSTFNNVKVLVKEDLSAAGDIFLAKGCIDETADTRYALHMEIGDTFIPTLHRHAIANLSELRYLYIENTGIRRIEPNAFYKMPKLVKLSLQHNDLKEIEADVFKNFPLISLNLKYNKISSIEARTFSIDNLRQLYLSDNELVAFLPSWFGSESNLISLEMDNNFVEYVPADAFAKFGKLLQLFLRNNRISRVHKNAFAGGPPLLSLALSCNRIKVLHEDLFEPLTRGLSIFDVQFNNLTYLPKKLLRKLETAISVDVHYNPLRCACFADILDWGKRTKTEVKYENVGAAPVCVASLDGSSVCEEVVDEEVIAEYDKGRKGLRCTCKGKACLID